MIKSKRPNTADEYGDIGFIQAKVGDEYKNIDHIYDSEGNIIFQQGYLNEYQGADDFGIPAIGKPLDDYTIWGNTKQEGVQTPDNPIEPEFVGERTENLFDVHGDMDSGHYCDDNGNIHSYNNAAYFYEYIKIDPTKPLYIYNAHDGINYVRYYYYTGNKEWILRSGPLMNGGRLTPPTGTEYIRLQISTEKEYQYIMITQEPINEEVFIPYGYKIPIVSRGVNLTPPLSEWVEGLVTVAGSIATGDQINRKERSSDYIRIYPGVTYRFSNGTTDGIFPTGSEGRWYVIGVYDINKQFIVRYNATFTAPENAAYCRLSFRSYGQTENTMFNVGSTPLPYEPYVTPTVTTVYLTEPLRRFYDIHNGRSDYIDYGTHKHIKTVGFLELTGQETSLFLAHTTNFVFGLNTNDALTPTYPSTWAKVTLCSHGSCASIAASALVNMDDNTVRQRVGAGQIYFKITGLETLDDFRAWLAEQYAKGTPVTIWYVLRNPIETDIELPEIPTLQKGLTTVIDVETTLEPSEVDVTYRGATKPKYDLFLAKNGDSFEAKDGQSLYIGGNP